MQPWDVAWQAALYGPHGFYRRSPPAEHFRTSVSASPLFAGALALLARECGLGAVVDVGSGRGELLRRLADVDPSLRLVGVDVVPRPLDLPTSAVWVESPGGAVLPELECADALVVANEWLDDVPCPVLEVDDGGLLRVVEVAPDGTERLGAAPTPEQLEWAERWWPAADPGTRVEVGLPRDAAWSGLVAQAPGSVLVAVDYAHSRDTRPAAGTLQGYRGGRSVAAVPDGTCDVTAHVALDAVAAAGGPVAASVLVTQREALLALGVSGTLPPHSSAAGDPAGYLAGLVRAASAAELLEPGGLGGFGWLVQSRGPALPAGLVRAGRQAVTGRDW